VGRVSYLRCRVYVPVILWRIGGLNEDAYRVETATRPYPLLLFVRVDKALNASERTGIRRADWRLYNVKSRVQPLSSKIINDTAR
jgi:hypothetical protein